MLGKIKNFKKKVGIDKVVPTQLIEQIEKDLPRTQGNHATFQD